MATALSLRRITAPAWVRPEALNVSPALQGLPLAPHGRRVAAMLLDLAIVAALSNTGEFWIAAGVGAIIWQLRHRQEPRPPARTAGLWVALALLAVIGVNRATGFVETRLEPALGLHGAAARPARDADDDDAAAAALAASTPASAGEAIASALDTQRALARVARLERELAEARKPAPIRWRDEAVNALHKLGRGLGWTVAYFTLLPFWWRGHTIGKRLFGLRVMELTGKRLGVMNTFGRYGGYAAGLATGGTGFLQVLWDPNRQGIHDKIAHTVVIDERSPRASAPAPAPAPAADSAGGAEPA